MLPEIDWSVADGISDEIIDLVNARLEVMRRTDSVEPFQILAGQLLGLRAFLHTMPAESQPMLLQALVVMIDEVLKKMIVPEGRRWTKWHS